MGIYRQLQVVKRLIGSELRNFGEDEFPNLASDSVKDLLDG